MFYRRYVDNILVLSRKKVQLIIFMHHLNLCRGHFKYKNVKANLFVKVEISRCSNEFITFVKHKREVIPRFHILIALFPNVTNSV